MKRRIDRGEAARQWNHVVENIDRLYESGVDPVPKPIVATPAHPWKIRVTEEAGGTYKITVEEGIYFSGSLYEDTNGDAVVGARVSTVPETEFAGLSATSDNGIWLELGVATPASNYPAILGQNGQDLQLDGYSQANVIKDAARTLGTGANYAALIAAQAGKSYFYIGRVNLAAGVATITQDLKHAFTAIHPSYLLLSST